MQRISNTFKSVGGVEIGTKTIGKYLEYLQDSFIISEALRYDVKGRKYIGAGPSIISRTSVLEMPW